MLCWSVKDAIFLPILIMPIYEWSIIAPVPKIISFTAGYIVFPLKWNSLIL